MKTQVNADPQDLIRRLRANGALTAAEQCRKRIQVIAKWLMLGVINQEWFNRLRDQEIWRVKETTA